MKALHPTNGPTTVEQLKKLNMKKGKLTSADLINTALAELNQQPKQISDKILAAAKPGYGKVNASETATGLATVSQDPNNNLNRNPIWKAPEYPIPLQDRVLITRSKPESVTAGGIIIPEMAVKSNNEGYVMAVGPLVGVKAVEALKNDQADFCAYPKIGDKVLFGEYAGSEIQHNGKEYLLMRENDIMAILPE